MILPWKGSRIALIAAAAEKRRFKFFLCCLTAFGGVGFSFFIPQIVRYTIDSVIGKQASSIPILTNIWICTLLIAVAGLCSALCNMARRFISMEIGETVAWKLRNVIYAHIQKLPYNWHVKCQTGDIIQRCTTDIDNIRNFIQNQLVELMRTIFVLIVAVTLMFSMDVFMSLMAMSLIPFIIIFSVLFFRKASREFARADEAEGIMQSTAQENYTGVRVVRAFGREAHEVDKFYEKTKTYKNIWVKIGKLLGVFWGAGDFISGLQLLIVVGAGVYRCIQGDLSAGTFFAFYTYCNWMIWPVRQLGRILSELSRTLVATGRVREILSVEPESGMETGLEPEIKGEICFKNVSFKYEAETPVLRNISFTVKPGTSMAILGATGSGKSSLVHLLCRFYDLGDEDGLISIDGIDIRKISLPHLRRHIGLCLQETFLFSKTIMENIALPNPRLEITDIKNAAAAAMVDETIEGFADGYNTVIGERGVTLSGGQKQRVAIARMLACNTTVMIFDDSLSAVDTETDAKIRTAIDRTLCGKEKKASVIIISHRISSLMQADKILVLKDGTVEDIGSHEELLGRDGSYRRIFEMQKGINDG